MYCFSLPVDDLPVKECCNVLVCCYGTGKIAIILRFVIVSQILVTI